MAITALLLAGVLAGRGALFQNSQFTGAMDDAQNLMRQIQNEANQALSTNQINTGQSSEVVFGRLVQLSTAYNGTGSTPGAFKTWTLIGHEDDTGNVTALSACNEQDMAFQDSVQYNPGASPSTTSIVFTRNTGNGTNANASATGGQVFVAPVDTTDNGPAVAGMPIGGTVLNGAPPCPTSGSPLPPSTVPPSGPQSPCTTGSDVRTPGSGPVDFSCPTQPAAPALRVTDAEGTSADTTTATTALTTSSPPLQIKITLPVAAPAAGDAYLVDNGTTVLTIPFAAGATSATGTYTMPSTGNHSLTAYWMYNGNLLQSQSSAPAIQVTYQVAPPSTCSNPVSISQGYECGLVGSYYRGDQWDKNGQRAQTIAIDGAGAGLNIGTNLGGGQSAYSNFIPTLRLRTGQADAQYASVKWTGQLYLKPGSQPICIQSDDGASITIGSTSFSDGGAGAGVTCQNLDGGSFGAWDDVTINYANSGINGEGSASFQLLTQTGAIQQATMCAYYDGFWQTACTTTTNSSYIQTCQTGQDPPDLPQGSSGTFYTCRIVSLTSQPTYGEVDGSRLRTKPVATVGPPPSPQGLNANYWTLPSCGSGCTPSNATWTRKGSATVDGVGTASSPATAPDWFTELETLTGTLATQAHPVATWTGYLQIPQNGTYQFCTGADDVTAIYFYDLGKYLTYENSYSPPPGEPNPGDWFDCGNWTYLTVGQHPIYMFNEELSANNDPATNGTSFEVTYQQCSPNCNTPGYYSSFPGGAVQIPLNWYTTTDTFVAANTQHTLPLPGEKSLVDNLEMQARHLSQPAPGKSGGAAVAAVLQAVRKAITPQSAWAAAAGCDSNILNPVNYLEDCPAFTTVGGSATVSVPVEVNGDTTRQANLQFNTSSNAITWSIR